MNLTGVTKCKCGLQYVPDGNLNCPVCRLTEGETQLQTTNLPFCGSCGYAPESPWLCEECIHPRVPKPKQAGEKLEVVAGPAREKVSKGCSVCDPENEGERKYICGTCVQLSLAEGIKKKKTNRENKKRKRLPFESWMNHRQARIYGKHVLWQSYCRKCANWYFEDQDGRRDCDCCGKDVSLKEYRNKRRLTQLQLAEEWKISQPMIAQMEKGIKPIPARFQRKMSGK